MLHIDDEKRKINIKCLWDFSTSIYSYLKNTELEVQKGIYLYIYASLIKKCIKNFYVAHIRFFWYFALFFCINIIPIKRINDFKSKSTFTIANV